MSADRLSAAMIRQEAIARRSEEMAAAYAELAVHAEALGLPDEARRMLRNAKEFRDDAAQVRSW